jgi:hypothetical protein
MAAHVVGTQGGVPQTLACPPAPQTSDPVQVPHARVPPQPSPAGPQLNPSMAHVVGVHVDVDPH